MASSIEKASTALHIINTVQNMEHIIGNIRNRQASIPSKENTLPFEPEVTADGIQQRKAFLENKTILDFPYLITNKIFDDLPVLNGNIENYIGMTRVPTGVIGPLHVIGSSAQGDFYVPLATSEGALVASYHRGTTACSMAGGIPSSRPW